MTDDVPDKPKSTMRWADESETPDFAPLTPKKSGGIGTSLPDDGFTLDGQDDDEALERSLPASGPYCVFIGGLRWEVTEDELRNYFGDKGLKALSVRLVKDEQKQSKGFGYAEFDSRSEAKTALRCNGENWRGRVLKIDVAERRGDGPSRDRDRDRRKGGGGRDRGSDWYDRDRDRGGGGYGGRDAKGKGGKGRDRDREDDRDRDRKDDRWDRDDRDRDDRDRGKGSKGRDKGGGKGGRDRDRDDRDSWKVRGDDRDRRDDRDDRDKDRDRDRGGKSKGRGSGDRGGGYEKAESAETPKTPSERPKLMLKPRTKPLDQIGQIPLDDDRPKATKPDPFGGARPAPTASVFRDGDEEPPKRDEAAESKDDAKNAKEEKKTVDEPADQDDSARKAEPASSVGDTEDAEDGELARPSSSSWATVVAGGRSGRGGKKAGRRPEEITDDPPEEKATSKPAEEKAEKNAWGVSRTTPSNRDRATPKGSQQDKKEAPVKVASRNRFADLDD